MLLSERVPLYLLFVYVVLSFIDILTPKGNEIWEKYIGFPGRYAIMQGEKVGYVNARCRLLIRPVFDEGAGYFKEGISPVRVGKKWGYIDTKGHMVVAPAFRFAGEVHENRAYVSYLSHYRSGNLKFGYIDGKGNSVIPGIYARAQNFSEGVAGVMDGGVWGFIRFNGEWLNAQRFEDVKPFSDNLAAAKKNGLWGFVDRSGIFIIRPLFQEVKSFSEGAAAVKEGTKWGYLDRSGKWLLEPRWSLANSFSNGLAIADGHYIDKTGNIVINGGLYGELTDFSEGYAAVEIPAKYRFEASKWGYIDTKGEFLFQPRFELAKPFKGGLARVSKDKNGLQRGYVFTDGRLVWDPADWEKSAIFQQNVRIAQTVGIFIFGLIVLKFIRYRQRKLYALRTIS